MPCNSIQMSSVTFSLENTDFELFKKAMTNLGFSAPEVSSQGVLTFYKGRDSVTVNGNKLIVKYVGEPGAIPITETEIVNAIKRAYSNQVVMATSLKFGWKLQTTGKSKYEVQR